LYIHSNDRIEHGGANFPDTGSSGNGSYIPGSPLSTIPEISIATSLSEEGPCSRPLIEEPEGVEDDDASQTYTIPDISIAISLHEESPRSRTLSGEREGALPEEDDDASHTSNPGPSSLQKEEPEPSRPPLEERGSEMCSTNATPGGSKNGILQDSHSEPDAQQSEPIYKNAVVAAMSDFENARAQLSRSSLEAAVPEAREPTPEWLTPAPVVHRVRTRRDLRMAEDEGALSGSSTQEESPVRGPEPVLPRWRDDVTNDDDMSRARREGCVVS